MHGPLPHPLVRVATVSRRETRLVAALLLCLAVAARWQTFGNPVLGYDEQFYLLVGDRMLHGALPYVDIFDRKPIGLFLMMLHMKPDYVELLWTDPMGIQMSVGAIILMLIGAYAIKKIVDIKV